MPRLRCKQGAEKCNALFLKHTNYDRNFPPICLDKKGNKIAITLSFFSSPLLFPGAVGTVAVVANRPTDRVGHLKLLSRKSRTQAGDFLSKPSKRPRSQRQFGHPGYFSSTVRAFRAVR